MACKVCELPADNNTLFCSGPCASPYHITCASAKKGQYKSTVVSSIKSIPNFRWFCNACLPLKMTTAEISAELHDRLTEIKLFVDALLTPLTSSVLDPQNNASISARDEKIEVDDDDVAALNGTFSSALSNEHIETVDKLTPPTDDLPPASQTPATSQPVLPTENINVTQRKNRIRARSLSPNAVPNAKQPKIDGAFSGNSDLTDHFANPKEKTIADLVYKPNLLTISDIVSKPIEKKSPVQSVTIKTNMVRSIYISPFAPCTTASDVIAILEREADLKHIVPNVQCKKLVGRGQKVRYASFKLDVRRDQFDIVMAAPIWKRTGNDEFIISEFVPQPNAIVEGPNGGKSNPFRPPTQNQPSRPSTSQISASSQPQSRPNPNYTAHHQNRPSRPSNSHFGASSKQQHRQSNYTAQHMPSQCQNFCNNDCCNPPRTRRNRRPNRYGGNRRGYQPYNGQ